MHVQWRAGVLAHACPRLLAEPVRVADAGHGVIDPLHGGGDGNDLLDGVAQPLAVVLPVNHVPAKERGAEQDVVGVAG